LCMSELKYTNMHRVAVKKHNYICNVQKRTNVGTFLYITNIVVFFDCYPMRISVRKCWQKTCM